MKTILVPAGQQLWNEKTEKFLYTKETVVLLEHSLYTISLWEEKHRKRFLDDSVEKTQIELMDYIRTMIVNKEEVDDVAFSYLINTRSLLEEVISYISDQCTATVLPKQDEKGNKEPVSSELMYYWLFSAGIDKECEHWHLSRLMALLGIFSVKNSEHEKEDPKKIQERNKRRHEEIKREKIKKWKQEHPNESMEV